MASESAIYAEALLPKKHGFPFWLTEPHANLPYQYRVNGVGIGDVLSFTPDGGYDFFFNIFLDKYHPINSGRVPPDFEPLNLDLTSNVLRRDDWKNAGAHISTAKAKKLSVNGGVSALIPGIPAEFGAGFEFSSSMSRGGILVLSEGAARVDFRHHDRLRKYIDEHIDSWFQHVNGEDSRFDCGPQHLYIVTGCDKSTESAVASFCSPDGQEVSLKLTAAGASIGGTYSWTTESSADTRITPVNSFGGEKNQNHCVFARGFTYTRSSRSTRRGVRIKVSDLSTAKLWKSTDIKNGGWKSWWSNRSSSSRTSSSSSSSPKSSPPTSSYSSPVPSPPFTPVTSCEDLSLDKAQLHDSLSAISLSRESDEETDPEGLNFEGYPQNPSEIINKYMLIVDEDADYFVTHDDDWCSLEFEDPVQLLDRDALLDALTSRYAGINNGISSDHSKSPSRPGLSVPPLPVMDPAAVDFRAFYPSTPNEVKHRKRTASSQLKILEGIFKRDTKPNAALRNKLAAQLDITERGVQVWFQNRRAKEKNKANKSATAAAAKTMSSAPKDEVNSGNPSLPSEIHRLLAYTNSPALTWDLTLPPLEVKPAHPPLSAEVLKEPATNPPLPFIYIARDVNFPWKLTISAQPGSPFLTVGDVISGLYYWLRQPVTAEEFAHIPSQTMRDTVRETYLARCNRTLYPEKELVKGVKRIDFLCQKTRFMGLAKTGKDSPETFQLVAA